MENEKVILDTKKLKIWESMSEEQKIEVLIYYMKGYKVDKTHDNYVLLALATNGFLDIVYHQRQNNVLRYIEKDRLFFVDDDGSIWENRIIDGISIIHTVPNGHLFHSLVEYTQSNLVENNHSKKTYAFKLESDFMLTYLLLLIKRESLINNFRRIFLEVYQSTTHGFHWGEELDISYERLEPTPPGSLSTFKINSDEWETFVVTFLGIKSGSVLDMCANIGTLAVHLDLANTTYTANMPRAMENDLMTALFYTDTEFSKYYKQEKIKVCDNYHVSIKEDERFDYVVFNKDNMYNIRDIWKEGSHPLDESYDVLNPFRYKKDSLEFVERYMSIKGKALLIVDIDYLRFTPKELCKHYIDSIILLCTRRCVVFLNKNKKKDDPIKIYDRVGWNELTTQRLLDSICREEDLLTITAKELEEKMGGYLDIDTLMKNQYKIEIPSGYKLIRLSEFANSPSLKESSKATKKLAINSEEYTPLSPYTSALVSSQFPDQFEINNSKYVTIDQKLLIVLCYSKSQYWTYIFDPKNGDVCALPDNNYISVDEEKVNIDYLVYEMNQEYFLMQLFPFHDTKINGIKVEDILSCQILVPDVESSVERQKQIIEDLRQKEIAAFARRYGYDLGEFVQYKDSDLPNGAKLKNGKYTIQKIISRGGFGKVYEAQNEETQEVVAIKEFFHYKCQVRDPQTNEVKTTFDANIDQVNIAKEKFRREKAKIQECAHDNIVKVYEEFEENNTCYYSMEYIDGENLVNKKGIGEREALAIIRQVAEALKAMHAKGYNHSDVKPQNILLDSNGVVTLIDFGGAHCYGNDDEKGMSASPYTEFVQIKSEGYTPMQAYKMEGFHAGRDIYSLGATMYYMLTGNKPATIDKQMKPDKISSKSWKGICKAMEEDPRIWLRSMDAFLALLPGDEEAEINNIDVSEPTRKWRITPRPVVELKRDEVFVFGSNIKGLHTGSAAKQALKWGAQMGVASGPMGNTYAIPTVKVTGFDAIERYVSQFIKYVEGNDHITFYVTAIGCGNAGFSPEQIAPLFRDCIDLSNVYLPESFWRVLRNKGFIK